MNLLPYPSQAPGMEADFEKAGTNLDLAPSARETWWEACVAFPVRITWHSGGYVVLDDIIADISMRRLFNNNNDTSGEQSNNRRPSERSVAKPGSIHILVQSSDRVV